MTAAGLIAAPAAGGTDTRAAFGSAAISGVGAGLIGNTMMSGSKDAGHRLSAGYAFANGFALGTTWESLKWDMSYTTLGAPVAASGQDVTQLKKNAWRLEASYVTGSHSFGGAYTRANQITGTAQLNGTAVAGVTYGLNLSGTGARAYQLNYAYQLSKRTHLTAYYTGITNDSNARYGVVFNSIGGGSGSDSRFYGAGFRHAF